ncbi:MAG: DUF5131 family protein, partial [Armatimonadetes bacterium]|nr:DUF5131 family protein [Armatimonadota bacterium]NIO96604.1 DUF5131 family protein [Armatimonadota bacterium]
DFPENAWVGVSCTSAEELVEEAPYLLGVNAKTRFLSCEPWFGDWSGEKDYLAAMEDSILSEEINWLIIGALSARDRKIQPDEEALKILIDLADRSG